MRDVTAITFYRQAVLSPELFNFANLSNHRPVASVTGAGNRQNIPDRTLPLYCRRDPYTRPPEAGRQPGTPHGDLRRRRAAPAY
jgi:hypothetical protein